MATNKLAIRKDTAANWTSADTVLEDGEWGQDTDTGKFKLGDGVTAWTSLDYALLAPQDSLTDTTEDRLMKVGAFGLGKISVTDESTPDSVDVTSVFRISGTSQGPTGSGSWYTLHVNRVSGAQAGQLSWRDGSPGIFYRNRDGSGVWSEWYRIRDSADYPSDTAWTTTTSLDNGWTGTVSYIKRAGWVTVVLDAVDGSGNGGDITLLNIPAGYKPDEIVRSVAIDDNDATSIVRFTVTAGGNVQVEGTGDRYRGSITYPVI